jgi:hypothetical protein
MIVFLIVLRNPFFGAFFGRILPPNQEQCASSVGARRHEGGDRVKPHYEGYMRCCEGDEKGQGKMRNQELGLEHEPRDSRMASKGNNG